VSLTADEIAAVAAELAPLVGGRVSAVRVHGERTWTLDFRGPGAEATLLLCAEPELARLGAVARRPPAPGAPHPLQAPLRRELEGARLGGVEARLGERAAELRLERRGGTVRLLAELGPRGGRLALLGPDGAVLLSSGRAGLPPKRPSPGAAPARPPAAGSPPPRFAPVAGAPFPLSAAVEAAYLALEAERRLAAGRRRLREPLRAAVGRGRRALVKLAAEAARVPAAEADRRAGDLLKLHLGSIRRGTRSARLVEWTAEGPREVAVELDPALSPRENMERHYRRWRRIAESAGRVAARRAEVEARGVQLEALLAAVAAAEEADLPRLEREARRLGASPRPPPPPRARAPERLPYRSFRSLAGVPILVGRGPEDNDALTARFARGNDLWLHARGRGGAHVVARLTRGKAPDQETLLDAAHLAAHFSDGRREPAAEVVWTRAKHVRKPRGSAAGAATYSQERTLALRLEPARLERLLGEEED
jgi:predicted ribosome quality control (RQC) complex YloA/Tae2 family protein